MPRRPATVKLTQKIISIGTGCASRWREPQFRGRKRHERQNPPRVRHPRTLPPEGDTQTIIGLAACSFGIGLGPQECGLPRAGTHGCPTGQFSRAANTFDVPSTDVLRPVRSCIFERLTCPGSGNGWEVGCSGRTWCARRCGRPVRCRQCVSPRRQPTIWPPTRSAAICSPTFTRTSSTGWISKESSKSGICDFQSSEAAVDSASRTGGHWCWRVDCFAAARHLRL